MLRLSSRALAVGITALALTLGFGASAFGAYYKNIGSISLRTSNNNEGSFSGNAEFYAQGTSEGGFHVWGNVCDNSAVGNGVYGQGRVEGYGWSSRVSDGNGSQSGCGWDNRYHYDPAATWVNRGQYQVCVDDFGADTCGTTQWYYRH
jgi:hypothetical protein